MKYNKKKGVYGLIILYWLLSACSHSYKQTPKRVSVENLKQIVFLDTEHYKIVYLYNPLCGSCISSLSEILDFIDDSKGEQSVCCYLFSIDSYRWYLPKINITKKGIKAFWISPESEASFQNDSNYVEKILRVFIPDSSVSVYEGTPQTLVFSPENTLLRSHEDSLVIPANISFLKKNMSSIDFSVIQQ